MSILSSQNSFKQLEEHLDNPFDTSTIQDNLNDFWEKINDIKDEIDPSDGDHMPSE